MATITASEARLIVSMDQPPVWAPALDGTKPSTSDVPEIVQAYLARKGPAPEAEPAKDERPCSNAKRRVRIFSRAGHSSRNRGITG